MVILLAELGETNTLEQWQKTYGMLPEWHPEPSLPAHSHSAPDECSKHSWVCSLEQTWLIVPVPADCASAQKCPEPILYAQSSGHAHQAQVCCPPLWSIGVLLAQSTCLEFQATRAGYWFHQLALGAKKVSHHCPGECTIYYFSRVFFAHILMSLDGRKLLVCVVSGVLQTFSCSVMWTVAYVVPLFCINVFQLEVLSLVTYYPCHVSCSSSGSVLWRNRHWDATTDVHCSLWYWIIQPLGALCPLSLDGYCLL